MKIVRHEDAHKAWPTVIIRKKLVDGRWVFRNVGEALRWIRDERRRGTVSINGGGYDSFEPIEAEMHVYISNERVAFDFKMRFA